MHKLSVELKNTILDKMLTSLSEGQAFLFSENYSFKPVKPEKEKFTLEELQKLVGGYIEVFPCKMVSKCVFLCDEEGILKKRPLNVLFADILGEYVYGNMLIVPMELIK